MNDFYKQYLEVKKQHENELLFYRVGDFYELFGVDARVASEALNIILTSRDCGLSVRVPMCGVPYHSIDSYINKLIECGYKTVICEPQKELQAIEKENVSFEEIPQLQGKLKLTATGAEQKIILDYLEQNASDILLDKINNGVRIEKDGKTLICKKDLDFFMTYAYSEAQKQVEKNAKFACVDNDAVFGWAIHYFEEDSIEGKLYNEDGTEYSLPKPIKNATTAPTKIIPPKPQPKPQMLLLDLLDETEKQTIEITEIAEPETIESEETDDELFTEEEKLEIMEELAKESEALVPTTIDFETGDILDIQAINKIAKPETKTEKNTETIQLLQSLLEIPIKVRK